MTEKALTAKSSTVGEAVGFLFLLAASIGVLYFSLLTGESQMQVLPIAVFVGATAWIVLITMPLLRQLFCVYELDSTGIRCTRFGRCVRFAPWEEVTDVARIYQKGGVLFLVTTKDAKIFRRSAGDPRCFPDSAEFSRSERSGKYFRLKASAAVQACIEQYYGKPIYDWKARR